MKRRTTTAALSLVLLAGTVLSGCTSGDPEDETTPTTATVDAGEASDDNWFCRLIRKDALDAATDGRSAEATEVDAISEEDIYQCDVLLPTDDGDTEVAMSLSMHRNVPGEADARLAEVKAIEGAQPGPDHLGVSYVADTLAVSVVPCKAGPGAPEDAPAVPIVFTVRAPLDTEGAATALLDQSLTRMLREMDQSVGCSPSKIHENGDSAETTAP